MNINGDEIPLLPQPAETLRFFVYFVCMRGCLVSPFGFFFDTFKASSSSVLVPVVVICILIGQNKPLNRNAEHEHEVRLQDILRKQGFLSVG